MLPDIIRGELFDYRPRSRRRAWGGMWEGVVQITDHDGTLLKVHVCDDVRESETDALADAGVDALVLYAAESS